jgi:L-cysteate sulfo-lyase
MSLEQQARVALAFLPTPVQELPRLTYQLKGPRVLIKRDDQTGLAFGGNKTRKLEFLLGDALKHDIDTVITAGAIQSNHCRQTAAAAAQLGLHCELLLNAKAPETFEGNVLLDNLLGAHIHWQTEEGSPADLEELAKRVRSSGHKPYIIPYGGSNSIGALGYVNAMREFMQQQKTLQRPVTHIVFASCSGATHVGLVIGAQMVGFSGEILAISVDYNTSKKIQFQQELADLGNATANNLGLNQTYTGEDFKVNYDYATGYAVVDELEREGIYILAGQEGILVDPVYSGRAFGALLDLIRKGYFSETDTVLFWHTGGSPALFPYAPVLTENTTTKIPAGALSEHLSEEELLLQLERAQAVAEIGAIYTHYRDSQSRYKVIGLTIIEATQEPGVLYQKESDSHDLKTFTWMRPLHSWIEKIPIDGNSVPRFRKVSSKA